MQCSGQGRVTARPGQQPRRVEGSRGHSRKEKQKNEVNGNGLRELQLSLRRQREHRNPGTPLGTRTLELSAKTLERQTPRSPTALCSPSPGRRRGTLPPQPRPTDGNGREPAAAAVRALGADAGRGASRTGWETGLEGGPPDAPRTPGPRGEGAPHSSHRRVAVSPAAQETQNNGVKHPL